MPAKKKKGHHPAHQNTFAFQHNPGSKLTAKILASPNVGLCRRCHDKIEWRKQYRKYKPLSQPSRCNICKRRNITAAYHTICDSCAMSNTARKKMFASSNGTYSTTNTNPNVKVCAMCVKEPARIEEEDEDAVIDNQIQKLTHAMEIKLKRPLKLRESKGIERKVYRAHERMKEEAKAERRRLRDEADEAKRLGTTRSADAGHGAGQSPVLVDDDEESGEEGQEEEDGQEGLDGQEKELSQGGKESGDSNFAIGNANGDKDEDEDNSDYDPFLQAVGGKDKLLTGEAYQQMMLEKGRFEQNTNLANQNNN
jgi:hypothetical protein